MGGLARRVNVRAVKGGRKLLILRQHAGHRNDGQHADERYVVPLIRVSHQQNAQHCPRQQLLRQCQLCQLNKLVPGHRVFSFFCMYV